MLRLRRQFRCHVAVALRRDCDECGHHAVMSAQLQGILVNIGDHILHELWRMRNLLRLRIVEYEEVRPLAILIGTAHRAADAD